MTEIKNKLDKIKENIRTINPEITDELLDLLYEYISEMNLVRLQESLNNKTIRENFKKVTINKLVTK